MKRTKQVILARGLAVGVPTALPHKLVDESGPLVPDRFEILGSTTRGDEQSLFGPSAGYDIAASPAAVVITRLTVAVSPDIEILCSRSGLFGPGEFLGALDTAGYKVTTGVRGRLRRRDVTVPARRSDRRGGRIGSPSASWNVCRNPSAFGWRPAIRMYAWLAFPTMFIKWPTSSTFCDRSRSGSRRSHSSEIAR